MGSTSKNIGNLSILHPHTFGKPPGNKKFFFAVMGKSEPLTEHILATNNSADEPATIRE